MKCGICGVLDAEVSFDSCIVMMLCCVYEMFEFLHGALYAICVELKYFIYLFVFYFGGILFVSCMIVSGGVWWWGGEKLGWMVLGAVVRLFAC